MILYMIYKDKKKQVIPMGQPKGEAAAAAATVVDLGAILEMQEKAVVEIGAELEMQEKPVVAGDEAGGRKKEELAVKVVCLDLDGEKTVIPSIG
ncbi:hypothetical protein Hanom_Chr10g00887621 [Helianthus anomalus]